MSGLRVLVAGGAGFIGSHLCDALLGLGHEVTCLDTFCTGSLENLEEARRSQSFKLVTGDVVAAPLDAYDVIYHLASPASPVWYREFSLETMQANSAGTAHLLAMASGFHATFVFASTSEVYGDPARHPQTEDYTGNVNTLGPRACYDESKRFGEAITAEFHRRWHTRTAIVRIFNTYGPRMARGDGRVIPAFLDAADAGMPLPIQGSGEQSRSFCYVTDTVRALLDVGLDEHADNLVVNVGNPHEITIRQLAHEVAIVSGKELKLSSLPAVEDDPQRRCPDISRMRERYGWQPRVALGDGLRRTMEARRRVAAGARG